MGSVVWATEIYRFPLTVPGREEGSTPLLSNRLWVRHFHLCCSSWSSISWGHQWSMLGGATGKLVCWNQEVLGNLLRMVTSPNNLEKCQSLVVSSGGKNPELGVSLLVALTPTFMSLGNIKSYLIMLSLSSSEKDKTAVSSPPSPYPAGTSGNCTWVKHVQLRNDYPVLLSLCQSYLKSYNRK